MHGQPKVFHWIGNSAPTLYWDDPANWAEGAYPNDAEAIAIFANALTQDTTIIIRQDIRLAHFWFNDKHSYTIAPDPSAPADNQPKLIFDTERPYATTFFHGDNAADHFINAIITHSCHWGFPGRTTPAGAYLTTLHLNGPISNYKEAKRASVQVHGRLKFELNAVNTFTGPVVVTGGGEVAANRNGAIPDGTTIYIEEGGKIAAPDGVVIKTRKLRVDGRVMEEGLYHADGPSPDLGPLSAAGSFDAGALSTANKIYPLSNVVGGGAILVTPAA